MNIDTTIGMTDRIIEQLEATRKEIEQFIQELNLESGTTDERYQQLKNEFRSSIDQMRAALESKQLMTEDAPSSLLSMLNELKERLDKTEKNNKNEIKQLIKGIKKSIKSFASSLATETSVNEILNPIHDQLQRYRLKLEIIKLKMALGTLRVKYAGKDMQYYLNLKTQALSKFLRGSKYGAEEKLRKAHHMINRIYSTFGEFHL